MEHATSSTGDGAAAKFTGQPAESKAGAPTSVAAAAPESSTLAVKLSEDHATSPPETVYRRGSSENDRDNKQSDQSNSRSLANSGEGEGEGGRGGPGSQTQVIRRSRSGRLLRTTVQYDERSSRGSSPEEATETPGSLSRRTRSSFRKQEGEHSGDGTRETDEQSRYDPNLRNQKSPDPEKKTTRQSENNSDKEGSDRSFYSDGRGQGPQYTEDNRDELATDEDQEEDGYAEDGDDAHHEEGSESMDNNSSKNGDGGDPLVVSMYGSPSLVKVRSMFIDKLYKMVEDPSIQHLISWAKEGDMFYVFNCIELSSSVLPKFFKHNNWQSFVRQLNMYGFHKIYRYDREESTLNRRNPETQRWQFYHPDFQRDRPHLRSNIKRKSARSINIAPTFSRVVFERDKGYYVQQDSTGRPFGGHGGHNRAHSSIQLQDPARHGYTHGAPPSGPHHFNPHPSHMHQPPHDSNQRHPPRVAAGYRPHPSEQYPVDFMHSREDKEMMQARRDHGHAPHPQSYPGPPQHHQHPSYGGAHQRQHSYAGPPPPPQYSSDPYGPKAQGPPPNGFTSPHGPPPPPPQQDPYHSGAPPSHPVGSGRIENRDGHSPGRDPGYLEHGHDYKQGMQMSGGHFRSQSAPGLDPRRAEAPRGPHPFSQQDHPRSPPPPPPHPNAQSYFPRESYPPPHSQPPRHSPHRQQGSFDESPSKGLTGPDAAVGASGEGPAPPGRGSVTKHPLSPMGHPQPHPSASPSGHHPPTPSQVQHPYAEQHRRNHSMAMAEPMDVDHEHSRQRRFTPPPPPTQGRHDMQPPSPSSLPQSHPHGPPHPPPQHQQAPLDPALPVESHPAVVGMDPAGPHPSAHDLVPRTVKQLEDRLHFVEDAYMSLRQFAQELQTIQVTQDHTIAWMRDRIDQLLDMGASRGISSPPLPHSGGVVPSKRKAEYSPSDARDWSRRGPGPEHPQQHSYQRQGPPASGPLAPPPAPPSCTAPAPPSQGPGVSPPEHGGQQQQHQHQQQQQQQQQQHSGHGVSAGPANAGRYESAGYHSSPFNPTHHPVPSPRTPSQ